MNKVLEEFENGEYERAKALVVEKQKASISMIQRYLRVGYNQAARLAERMETEGVIGPINNQGVREVLLKELRLKVFEMNDCDWYMAETAEQAKKLYDEEYGPIDDCEPRELSQTELERLEFFDMDLRQPLHSFAFELAMRIKSKCGPGLFASTEV